MNLWQREMSMVRVDLPKSSSENEMGTCRDWDENLMDMSLTWMTLVDLLWFGLHGRRLKVVWITVIVFLPSSVSDYHDLTDLLSSYDYEFVTQPIHQTTQFLNDIITKLVRLESSRWCQLINLDWSHQINSFHPCDLPPIFIVSFRGQPGTSGSTTFLFG